MNERSTFYWSNVNQYEACPQRFLWGYGWDGIDLGRGPGNPKELPPQGSRHHAVMGIVIQAVLEQMYNQEMWRDPKILHKRLLELVELEWALQERKKRNHIDFPEAGMSRAEMMEVCKEGVTGYLQTMKTHKLLGPYARAEVELLGWINKWTAVGGIADFIIRREDTGITILDGKNTKHRMKGVDPDQLRFYALVFRLAYKVLPTRLGFVWYRYPKGHVRDDPNSGQEVIEEGVDWIPFTKEDLQGLAARVVEAREGMRKEKFEATPSPQVCKNCQFSSVCSDRQAQRQSNGEKRAQTSKIEEIVPGGFSDLSLD